MNNTSSKYKIFKTIFNRSFLLASSNINSFLYPILYYILVIITFKIAVGAETLPNTISAGIIFTTNILMLLLTQESLLNDDYNLGFLEQFYLLSNNLVSVLIAKYCAHFLINMLIILSFLPIIYIAIDIQTHWSLLITAQILLSLNSILFLLFSSAILLGSQFNNLLSLIVLVFIIPCLIFATLSLKQEEYLYLLVAMFLFFSPIIMIACKHLIIIALEDKN